MPCATFTLGGYFEITSNKDANMSTLTNHSLPENFATMSDDVPHQLAMFGLGENDDDALRGAHEIIASNVEGLVQAFYNFVRGFPELNRFITPSNTHRLEEAFRSYLLTLGVELDDASYIQGRVRIGATHEKLGLPIKGYLGAYAHVQEIITRLIFQNCTADAEWVKLVCAINKVIMLDASMAVEAYHRVALGRVEQLMSQLEHEKEAIRRMAETDHLTGLLNRRYFYDCLDAEIQRCHRYGNSLCVLSLDLDDFKTINDSHGHHAGDVVLRTLSGILKQYARKTDKCGRLGGEEFGVTLVETNLETAQLMAERLRLAILKAEASLRDLRLSASVSIGIAQWSPRVADAAELLKQADSALYAAKEAGKNCIRIANVE